MTDQHFDAVDESVIADVPNRCPHLGVVLDSETWYTFPAAENYCHKALPPQPIALSYQAPHCLSTGHVDCPVYQLQKERWPGKLPKGIQGKPPGLMKNLLQPRNIVIALVVLAVLGAAIAGVYYLLTRQPAAVAVSPTPAPTSTVQPTATFTVTPTLTETPTPTITPSPTIGITETLESPTPNREAISATVKADTNLRSGPGTDFDVLGRVAAGTVFDIIGRDRLGVWLLVDVPELGEGWLFGSQIAQTINPLLLPIAPSVIGTPAPTRAPSAATPTTPPPPPAVFQISLPLIVRSNTCNYVDNTVTYEVRINEDTIEMQNADRLLTGAYDVRTGEFEASVVLPSGVRDTITGTIRVEGDQVLMQGREILQNTTDGCQPEWDFQASATVPPA